MCPDLSGVARKPSCIWKLRKESPQMLRACVLMRLHPWGLLGGAEADAGIQSSFKKLQAGYDKPAALLDRCSQALSSPLDMVLRHALAAR